MKITTQQLDDFVQRAVLGLPQDISHRMSDLQTLLEILPKTYANRQSLAIMMETLRAHERAQCEFTFPKQEKGKQ